MAVESKKIDLMIGRYQGDSELLPEKRRACVDAIQSVFADAAANLNNSLITDAWMQLCQMSDFALNPKYVARYRQDGDENECLFLRKCKRINQDLVHRYVKIVHDFVLDTRDFVGEVGLDTSEYEDELRIRGDYWAYLMNPDEEVFGSLCIPEGDNSVQREIFGFDTFVSGRYVPAETIYRDGGVPIYFSRRTKLPKE